MVDSDDPPLTPRTPPSQQPTSPHIHFADRPRLEPERSTKTIVSQSSAAPHELRSIPSTSPSAHHIEEFGEVDRIVHMPTRRPAAAIDVDYETQNQPSMPKSRSAKWIRLAKRLFLKRHLMQYFYNGILYRTKGVRKVSTEELFLDLVIVAAIAALGHELRESALSWEAFQKFWLLFTAVYFNWRGLVVLWNLWGVNPIDLGHKIAVYLTVMSLIGIPLGAHDAFTDLGRRPVAISAFLATVIPALCGIWFALNEKLLKNSANRINQLVLMNIFNVICVIPYLCAAFVRSERATIVLYWTAFAMQGLLLLVPYKIYNYLHRNIPHHTRVAVNIELFVEKFEVLTMIVMGETFIGLLFEAGTAITKDGVRIGYLYLSAFLATATLYSIQTLYVHVDSPILKGGRHAIRHNTLAGYAWGYLHMPYHTLLILFATGLSISVRDVANPPKSVASEVISAVIRADGPNDDAEEGAVQFTRGAQRLYAVGWGGSVILSGLLSALHKSGPRARTKYIRLPIRFAVAVGIMVGLPYAKLKAEWFQLVIAGVSVFLSLAEFVLVHMERVGFFRQKVTADAPGSSVENLDNGVKFTTLGEDDEFSDSESSDEPEEGENNRTRNTPQLDLESGETNLVELQNRLIRKGRSRMEVVDPSRVSKKHVRTGFG